ncbi:hypothetical protein TgHK011_002449 [Trichoderma gracile]|nr:hypothetical protein TgHK011_002449 [Trichoderma gracile]
MSILSGFVHVLGEFATVKSTFAIQQVTVKLISSRTGEVLISALKEISSLRRADGVPDEFEFSESRVVGKDGEVKTVDREMEEPSHTK